MLKLSSDNLAKLRSDRCSVVIPKDLKEVKWVPWHQHLTGIPSGLGQ